jgi:hypothetical protein
MPLFFSFVRDAQIQQALTPTNPNPTPENNNTP